MDSLMWSYRDDVLHFQRCLLLSIFFFPMSNLTIYVILWNKLNLTTHIDRESFLSMMNFPMDNIWTISTKTSELEYNLSLHFMEEILEQIRGYETIQVCLHARHICV